MLVVATAGSLCNAYSLQPLHPQPLMQRAASPVMQFGFQNYDRKTEAPKRNSNPLNYLNPIPGGSNEYPYGEKELPSDINVGGINLPTFGIDRRAVALTSILGLLAFVPLFVLSVVLATPGDKSPFGFLDFVYPPAVTAKAEGRITNSALQNAAAKKAALAKKEAAKKAEAEAKVMATKVEAPAAAEAPAAEPAAAAAE